MIQLRDRQGGQLKIVGHEDEALALFNIDISDASQRLRILLDRSLIPEHDRLVRSQPGVFVHNP